MLLLYVPGRPPLVLVFLTLALALYLTVVELRELRQNYLWWCWWIIVVFLTHFVGYLALRIYALVRRRREARA